MKTVNRSNSNLVLVYNKGQRYHVENALLEFDLFDFNEAMQVKSMAYTVAADISNKPITQGISADFVGEKTFIIDCSRSGLAFIVEGVENDDLHSANVYTCSGIRSAVSGEDITFISDALAFGLGTSL